MIAKLKIINFLGVRQLEVELGKLTMFCGDNAAGKSSMQQALRYALTAEPTRVSAKSEYAMLVNDGGKKSEVEVVMDDGEVFACSITGSGKRSGEPNDVPDVLPFLLDQTRFADRASPAERRELLFSLLAEPVKADKVLAKVRMLGGDVGFAEKVTPLLRSGFSTMQAQCEEYAKEQRAAWKSITGETYGADKAPNWHPPVGIYSDRMELAGLLSERERAEADAMRALNDFMPEYEKVKQTLTVKGVKLTCHDCGAEVGFPPEEVEQAEAGLASAETTLKFLQTAVDTATEQLKQSRDAKAFMDSKYREMEDQESRAFEAHQNAEAWKLLAGLFSFDSIPQQFLDPVVKALNARLAWSASETGWPQVAFSSDGEVIVGGRLYKLCAESEKWRADAMLAEALSTLSGLNLLVLDRVDVLAPAKRGVLVNWCMKSDAQCLLFATLKQKPEGLPAFWLEHGEIVE
jgi:hypothetical protein